MSSNTRKPDPASIDDSGKNLLEGSELLQKRRLQVERELNFGNWRHHCFPVLSELGQKNSGTLAASKNIGTQMLAPDLIASDMLNSRPPLGVEQDFVGHPIRDGLLADCGAAQEVGDALSKGKLIPGDLNSSLKSGNVRLIHSARGYTNRFVSVNNPVCVTSNKEACTVLKMTIAKRKQSVRPEPAPKKRREAIPGPDGKTLGQRVTEAMAYESGRRRFEYRQVDLVEDVNRLGNIPEDQQGKTQQLLSAIMTGKVSRSWLTPFIAGACHVNPLWLGNGAGKMLD